MLNIEEKLKDILLNKYRKYNVKEEKIMHRYNHSVSVSECMKEIILSHGYSLDSKMYYDGVVSGLLHDYSKFATIEEYKNIIEKYNLDKEYLNLPEGIMHALVGAYIVLDELSQYVNDDIIEAIKYHSTGKKEMSFLEKALYVSDYAESLRVGSQFESVRSAINESLDKAVYQETLVSVEFIASKGAVCHPLTLECLEYYKDKERV